MPDEKDKKYQDYLDGEHLRIKTLGMWADDEFPENFLENLLARYAEHFAKCEICQKNVAFYKSQRRPKEPTLKPEPKRGFHDR